MSLRYLAGYSLVILSRLLTRVGVAMLKVGSIPEQFALIIWTPKEIDRHTRARWNTSQSVQAYSEDPGWLDATEKDLVDQYFTNDGEVLNLACGAGREAFLLARRGLRVTACDWSPWMIAEAQREAQEAKLPIRFEVADLYDLQYPENTFAYLMLANIAYSYLMPRERRLRFLRKAHAVLKPGGVFIISFAAALNGRYTLKERLFAGLKKHAPFNANYERGDRMTDTVMHLFQPEELKHEFEETQFVIKEWLWDQRYAVLTKG